MALLLCLAMGTSGRFGPSPLSAQVSTDTLPAPPAAAGLAPDTLPEEGWNTRAALALAARGREARRGLVRSGALQSYQALTEGHIYFFVDPEEGERALIRVDQVAVELFWEAPDHVRQRLVGERSENRLPVREFRYYLDRLTLVQYGFGDEIQVGQGMDVSGVPHPLAPVPGDASGAEGPYDFRLADSISLHLPGEPEPLRIYELQVRPRNPEQPGILGSVYLNRSDAQLVRMSFTFTPASYVDRRTDRIAVELDYGLWEGEYWLPNTQRIEVRRELPELDLGVGTVIRAVLRVGDYQLNVPIPQEIRFAPAVTALPSEMLETYPFQGGLFSSLERDGLRDVATRADPRELRVEAARLLRNRPPTGLSPVRLHLPSASSLVSYDRTRGLDVGGGVSIRPRGALRMRLAGGWSFGPDRPRASVQMDGVAGERWTAELEGEWNGRQDLGAAHAMPPLLATLGAAALGEDYMDPYRSGGVALSLARPMTAGREFRVGLGVEQHRSEHLQRTSAPWNSDETYRTVLPIEEGNFGRGSLRWIEPLPWLPGAGRGRLTGDLDGLVGARGTGGRLELRGEAEWRTLSGAREIAATARLGTLVGEALPQLHRLAGGRATIPGHPFHGRVGRSLALAALEGAVDLGSPMLRLRAGLHGGWLDGKTPEAWDPSTEPVGAEVGPSRPPELRGGAAGGVSLGLGVLYDVLRIEGARGLGPGGEWQLLVSVDPRWWGFL